MLQALKTLHNRKEQVLLMKELGRYIQFRRTERQTVRHEILSADLALTPSFCPVWHTVAGHIRALLSASWLIFHNDFYLQRNLVTRYAMLRKSHTISRLGLRANKGIEQRRLGSSLKSRMGTRPLKFFWVTTSRVPMLWKGKSWEKGKEKGKGKKKKEGKKKTHAMGFTQKYGEKGEPKHKI